MMAVREDTTCQVVVVGGGPVGLTLAHELGRYGVDCVLIEPRVGVDPAGSPRCKQVNPRSMEHYRRLGIADDVREASGLPFGWSDSAVYCTSLMDHQLERFDGVFALSATPWQILAEPGLWCAQTYLEDALRTTLNGRDCVRVWWGWSLVSIEERGDGGVATVEDAAGTRRRIEAEFLCGADGGRSAVRDWLGVGLSGRGHAVQNLQVVFRAPGLGAAHPQGRAVQYWVVNPEIHGLMGLLNPYDTWWAILIGAPSDPSRQWVEQALYTMIGSERPLDVVTVDPWQARMLVAETYRSGSCFLLGDAAHLNPPWGGFGANTGIGDAVDLGWKLGAHFGGWAGSHLLDHYEHERRPIAQRAIAEAERNMSVLPPELSHPDMTRDDVEGKAARAAVAHRIRQSKMAEMYTVGFVLGTNYTGSSLVCPDDGPNPKSETSIYRPSAAPGARLPHHWLAPWHSLYDELGKGMTLLEIGAPPTARAWKVEAERRGTPLRSFRLNRPDLRHVYGADYLLIRPDQHVAWRGNCAPNDIPRVLDRVRGCYPPSRDGAIPDAGHAAEERARI